MAVGLTLKELAEKIGVSRTTVSRVMSGNAQKYRISEKTVKKVKTAAEQFGLMPNQVAQNLRLQKTDTIGLLIPDIANPFFANLARVVEEELRAHGQMLLLCNSNESTELEAETLTNIIRRQIDGLIVAPVGLSGEHFRTLADKPIVFIDRYFDELPIPHVSTDNQAGAFMATRYLLDQGHRHIACIQGLRATVSNQDRVAGYKRALKEQGGLPNIIGDGFTIENGYESAVALLAREEKPTALFALNNLIAVGALQALRDKGLSVPEDISLISFDEQPYFALTSPPVTTIQQPVKQIAKAAVQKLLLRLKGESTDSLKIQPEIIKRKSVLPPKS